jgi:hypothetical protein
MYKTGKAMSRGEMMLQNGKFINAEGEKNYKTETGKSVAFEVDQFDFNLIFFPRIYNNLKLHWSRGL